MKDLYVTHVRYDENDPIGRILALLTLSPVYEFKHIYYPVKIYHHRYIVVMYVTLILFRRDLHTISMFIGQVSVVRRIHLFILYYS